MNWHWPSPPSHEPRSAARRAKTRDESERFDAFDAFPSAAFDSFAVVLESPKPLSTMRAASTSSFRKYAASATSPETPRDHAMFASASTQSVLPEKPPKDDSMPQMATMISPGTPYSRSTSPNMPACFKSKDAPRSTRSRETMLEMYLRTLCSEAFRAAASLFSRANRARASSSGVAGAGAGAGAGSGSGYGSSPSKHAAMVASRTPRRAHSTRTSASQFLKSSSRDDTSRDDTKG